MKLDIKEIKNKYSITSVVGRYVELSHKNGNMVGLCPFHKEHTPSFNVSESKGIFKCFGCGESGDVLDFVQKLHNTDLSGSIKILDGESINNDFTKQENTGRKKKQWTPIVPPKNVIQPDFNHYKFGKPSKIHKYHTLNGDVLGFACRFDHGNGEKDVLPMAYCKDEMSQSQWRWSGMPIPRTLYNAHLINANKSKTIIIVEGEKCADYITKLIKDKDDCKFIATCWPGGSHSIKQADWQLLKGRNVILWPDNDLDQKDKDGNVKPWYEQPGNHAMLNIYSIIKSYANICRWIKIDDKPNKWDVADGDFTYESLTAFIRASMVEVPNVEITHDDNIGIEDFKAPTPIQQVPTQQETPTKPPSDSKKNTLQNEYFKFLGYEYMNNEHYHVIFSLRSKSVHHYKSTSLTKNNLMMLAPQIWWESNFPKKQGFDIDMAIDYIITMSLKVGIFDANIIRGRGAWVEGNSVIVNAGNYLLVNGTKMDISEYNSDYIYNAGASIQFQTSLPANKLKAIEFINILKLVNWERDISAYLLAGWCVVAPVCGALNWRPHIWVTGSAGTGKSWLFQKIVRRMVGKIALTVQSETSEAGIRQTLQHDARPVIFDEAEGEDRKAQERMQSVLNLMRSASTSDGGQIIKGSAGGAASSYTIKSCFAYASIGVMLSQQSDRSRVTIMSIAKDETSAWKSKWEMLQSKYNEIVSDEFIVQLRTRTLTLLPIILENAQTFSNAAAAYLGDQRSGDQIGVMLAGAYSLTSDSIINYQDAFDWVSKRDWSEEKNAKQVKDENNLLSLLIDSIVKVDTSVGMRERTIGELIEISCGHKEDDLFKSEDADHRLRRMGFKVDGPYLVVSNQSPFILDLLNDTPWRRNHSRILSRLNGAMSYTATTFSSAIKSRAVSIPLSLIFDKNIGSTNQEDIPF